MAKDAIVQLEKHAEGHGRGREQPGRRITADCEDKKRDRNPEDGQASVSKAGIPTAPAPFISLALFQALAVLGEGAHHPELCFSRGLVIGEAGAISDASPAEWTLIM